MSAETPAAPGNDEHYLRVFRRNFRAWRGTRPFWAGLFVMLGGLPIAYFPYANLRLGHLTLAMATTAGAGSLIIGVLLVVLGLSLWFQKHVRVFAGVAAILLALVSIPVSNLGGFLIGFLFALIGGAMAVSWAEGAPPAPARADVGGTGTAPGDTGLGKAPQAPVTDTDTVGASDDLSGTSPGNEANGRHSAG
ncbi:MULTISPECIES: DUF6114 domain-containing protein [unclassified Streptomyces]|uniref:DUF6114 domain-containing protein n=1 Tax=unclassified Streptomyces TaxID=2593676 RepID=UPI00093AFE8B|nr:DUF6114 domain-containing protein [Streptomyces sp. TSRI0107]OKJ85354.1 hypothetical protein AMK31_14740 [Streptomyces sp. TSRI0107]